METATRYIGSSIKRREDPRLLTGRATYVDDLAPPQTLAVIFVRSPHAHARLKGINAEAARAVPGVVAVLTGADVEASMRPVPIIWRLPDMKAPTRRAITIDKARFVGDIVAAVVAESRAIAEDAAELVEVDYEVLPAVTNQEAAMQPGAPLLHDDVPGNTARRGRDVFRQSEGSLPSAQRPEPRPQFGYTIVRSMMRRSSAR